MGTELPFKKKLSSSSFVKDWQGRLSFPKSLKLQEELKFKAKGGQGVVLGFESEQAMITMGFRADKNHILWSDKKLKEHNISQMEVQRGGSATLHSPGQLVIYPVLSLQGLGLKVKDFILALESITQSVLKDFDIPTKREGKYAGLWTERGKMCFFGIHISNGVSQQGLAINVNNDLSLFDSIKSCGREACPHDSLSFYKTFSLSKKELFFKWCDKALTFFS